MIYFTGIHATWNWKPNNITTVDYGYRLLLPSHMEEGKLVSKDSSFLKCESKIIPHGGRECRLIEKFFVIFRHGRAF